jgi:hypothetical protein
VVEPCRTYALHERSGSTGIAKWMLETPPMHSLDFLRAIRYQKD